MKLLILLLPALCAANVVPAKQGGVGDLKSLLEEIAQQANFDGMVALWQQKEAAADPDLMEVIDYLKSPDFKAMYDYLHDTSAPDNDWPNFLQYLTDNGLDVAGFEAWLAEQLGWNSQRRAVSVGDFKSLVDEFLALIPDTFVPWVLLTLAEDPDAQALLERLQTPEAEATALYFEKCSQYQDLLQFMRDDGIDIDSIIAAIKAFLWG